MKKRECYLVGGGLGNTGVAWARRAVAALVSQGQAGPGSSAHIHYYPGAVLCTSPDRAILPNTDTRHWVQEQTSVRVM